MPADLPARFAALTRFVVGYRCPRCGSSLLTNGRTVWCSFVGGRTKRGSIPGCTYGLDVVVRLLADDYPAVLSGVVFGFDGAGI